MDKKLEMLMYYEYSSAPNKEELIEEAEVYGDNITIDGDDYIVLTEYECQQYINEYINEYIELLRRETVDCYNWLIDAIDPDLINLDIYDIGYNVSERSYQGVDYFYWKQ